MNDETNNNIGNTRKNGGSNRVNNPDLADNKHDQDELKSESFTIDLPDVKDIPGQEFIHPLPLGEIADTTISSDDEEGVGILDYDEESEPLITGTPSNVSRVEKKVLLAADEDIPASDDQNLRMAELDSTDEEGTPLNEGTAGRDLDIAGADEDNLNEELGEEDEENNEYSLGADKD